METLDAVLKALDLQYYSFPTITISSILDILAVSVLIYYMILWIQKTRAWFVVKGLVLILSVSVIAYVLKLYTITWIISKTINVGLLAVVVLFQPEIRKALETIGRNSFDFAGNNAKPHNVTAKILDEIIIACTQMGKVRTGALIVLKQDISLSDYESTGIPIDSVVTSQLLMNIFEDKTPLHDGAVIINNGRIAAASCILPLTDRQIGQELGTRHRAAVGISEKTDAYVFIVSEETGAISIAKDGKLMKRLTAEEIRKIIKFNETTKPQKRVRWKGRL